MTDTTSIKDRFFHILYEEACKDNTLRRTQLELMYNDYGEVLYTAPASSKYHYHNAYEGGYLDHVVHVYDTALKLIQVYRSTGGVIDFTRAELAMAALHHDLWKLGIPNNPTLFTFKPSPYYLVETSTWQQENRGARYKINQDIPCMRVTDGARFILQSYGIALTYNEWMGIQLSDGIYDEANKYYLDNYLPFSVYTNLGSLIHWADAMSTSTERDPVRLYTQASNKLK